MTTPGGGDSLLKAVKYHIVQHTRGAGIELGRGPFKAFPHFIGVRERSDTTMPANVSADLWVDRFEEAAQHVNTGSLDFVFMCGLPDPCGTVRALRHLMKVGGHWVLALPGRGHDVEEIAHDWFRNEDYDVVVFEERDDVTLVVVRENDGGRERMSYRDVKRPAKSACVVRYGAIGDALQAASVLHELKAEGYHVTWMCEPTGFELLEHDPRIDAFLVQDKDQVPNHQLAEYWAVQAKKFDRFINLCESVEGSLVKLPGRADYLYPDALRREVCNHNYLEFMAKMAGLPFHAEHKFFATDNETVWAEELIADIAQQTNPGWAIGQKWVKPFVIMWALSGSSLDKMYPHMDAVIAKILIDIPHAHIITVGDPAGQILEVGWEDEPRVHKRAGEMKLRDTLALAQHCDLVIGPETGVLNAVAFEANAKIVLLSHSSPENLTKHWVNTEAIAPENTPCWPCHRLHYTREFCHEDPGSGAALCQVNKTPDRVWAAVQRAFVGSATVSNLLRPA